MRGLLLISDWFAPGYRAGGPITSCVNLTRLLAHECNVAVLTGCKDLGESQPYPGVPLNKWNDIYARNHWGTEIQVKYCDNVHHIYGAVLRATRELKPQTVYLNSMFSWRTCILPLLLNRWLGNVRIVLAPRGMLKQTALLHRPVRKRIWLNSIYCLRLSRRVIFHATSEAEKKEIQTVFGKEASIVVIPNVPRTPVPILSDNTKTTNSLKLAFVGRWHPIKNLKLVLQVLKDQKFDCDLDIIGVKEDGEYSAVCETVIRSLPSNIKVHVHGALPTDAAMNVVSNCHAMILPTEGENFGHAIFEAMGVGVPVIISDQTQWRELAASKAGWDLPLQQPEKFAEALRRIASWDQTLWQEYRAGAHGVAVNFIEKHDFRKRYLNLFFGDNPLTA